MSLKRKAQGDHIIGDVKRFKEDDLTPLLNLPSELLVRIVDLVDASSFISLQSSCKTLRERFAEGDMADWLLMKKYPHEYVNYSLIRYYCTTIVRHQFRASFKQFLIRYGHLRFDEHVIASVSQRGIMIRKNLAGSQKTAAYFRQILYSLTLQPNRVMDRLCCIFSCEKQDSSSIHTLKDILCDYGRNFTMKFRTHADITQSSILLFIGILDKT
jgi:hypothetical protein